MQNNIISEVQEKEKAIYRTVSNGQYSVKSVGDFARVTSILGAVNFDNGGLAKWKSKMARESFNNALPQTGVVSVSDAKTAFSNSLEAGDAVAKASAQFGTLVHSWLEEYALTGTFPKIVQDPYADVFQIFKSVQKFVKDFGIGTPAVQIIKPELFVYHSLGFAGTADLVVMRNNKVYLLDYKATNFLKLQYFLQLSAYTAALKELYGLEVEKATLIRFSKTGGDYEHVALAKEELATYFEMFKMCLLLYRFNKNPQYKSIQELNTKARLDAVCKDIISRG